MMEANKDAAIKAFGKALCFAGFRLMTTQPSIEELNLKIAELSARQLAMRDVAARLLAIVAKMSPDGEAVIRDFFEDGVSSWIRPSAIYAKCHQVRWTAPSNRAAVSSTPIPRDC